MNLDTSSFDLKTCVYKILNWDKRDITDILYQITRLKEYCLFSSKITKIGDHIDLTNLPTEDLSKFGLDGKENYPIWCCDRSGNCLVGDMADSIETFTSILGDRNV